MLGSSAGAGPGAQGLPGGRRNGGPAEATRYLIPDGRPRQPTTAQTGLTAPGPRAPGGAECITGPHAGDPVRSPSRALAGCGIRPSGGGSRPRGHAHKGRLPRGGSPRESGYQDWPAANDPQTPSVPGTKRPPGFGHPSDVGSRAFLSTAQSGPGTGARRMSRGSRARPLLDAPNPVDSLDDPTRDAARRPLESRNHGWDGRLPPTTDLDRAMIVRANVPGSGSGWRGAHSVWGGPCVGPRAHTKWASQVRPLLGPQGDLVTRAVSRAQGRSALEACARLPTGPLRARGPSLAAAGRARPAYIGRGVCVWHRWAMPTYLRADVGGGCGCICTYIYGWMGGCLRIPTDGCRRRAMPASVEADGHVRVAASVPVDGARLSGADKGARAPANWSPLAPPVSVWVSLDPVSVPGARRPTGHPRCLRGLPPTGHPAARPRGAPRRANSASQLAAARSPARLPLLLLLALLALLALPSSPSRARLSARLEGARLPGPQPPSTDSPQPGPSRAPPAALLLHIPTDLARPIIVRANVPGSERRSGGRPTCAGRPRAARAAMCPSQLVTAL
ncbi:hypothetical protein LV155_008834, partial [Aspergillus fumigatus]